MDPTVHTAAAPAGGHPADEATVDDGELGRRVVEWLSRDAEGRRILQALVEHPEVGRVALSRRLQRPGFLEPPVAAAPPSEGAVPLSSAWTAVPAATVRPAGARREPSGSLAGLERGHGLPHHLRLAATALFLAGAVAFVLGVLTLGHADPSIPPLSVFGLALMALSGAPALAGSTASERRWPRIQLLPAMPVTAAAVATAVTIAVTLARLLGR